MRWSWGRPKSGDRRELSRDQSPFYCGGRQRRRAASLAHPAGRGPREMESDRQGGLSARRSDAGPKPLPPRRLVVGIRDGSREWGDGSRESGVGSRE